MLTTSVFLIMVDFSGHLKCSACKNDKINVLEGTKKCDASIGLLNDSG